MSADIAFVTESEHLALCGLAVRIKVEVESEMSNAYLPIMRHALVAGALLKLAKAQVPHEQWDTWLQHNCPVACRWGWLHMHLHTEFAALPEPIAQRVGLLPMYEAIVAINNVHTAEEIDSGIRAARNVARDLMMGTVPRRRIETARRKLQFSLKTLESMLAAEGKK